MLTRPLGWRWLARVRRHARRHAGVRRRDRLPASSAASASGASTSRSRWGFAIANFVWWIGIGHAGTFISAILLLLRQKWRTSINRFAEAMTLFAVAMAGLFPILHLGRPWFFYWLVPYPDMMNLWPQWRSPLVWDFFAIAHLHHRVAPVLVRRPDPRPGDAARPRRERAGKQRRLRPARARLARRGAPLGAPRDGLPAARRPGDAARGLGAPRGVARLRRSATRPAGTRRSSRRTSSPARCSPASRWC